jgi:peptide/nickel transport system permease protein
VRGKIEPSVAAFRDPARLAAQSWRSAIRSDLRARIGTFLLLLLAILSIVSALGDPIIGRGEDALLPPSLSHPFGTDAAGRDLLRAIVQGTLPTFGSALVAATVTGAIGIALGTIGGYLRGGIDLVIHRAIEALTAVPLLLLVVVVQAFVPSPSSTSIMIAVIATRWAEVAQVVRADVLRVVELEHVVAARALGAGPGRIVARHVLPAVLASALVLGAFGVGTVIVLETAIAVVGIGHVHPLAWGALLGGARAHPEAWWLVAFPTAGLVVATSAMVLIGEAMRDALDPRLRFGARARRAGRSQAR